MNFLTEWKEYLLQNSHRIKEVRHFGDLYEEFVGKDEEVRKAGGVYYTPQYIVDYIVEETLGKLIAGKTPEEISAIKVLDPSCVSGSFLIGAYQALLDYHLAYYKENPNLSLPLSFGEGQG